MYDIIIGVDIAKYKFDVAIIAHGISTALQFTNNQEGFKKLLSAIPKDRKNCWFVMEATGNYGNDLARFLHDLGHKVSILNPAQVKYFAKSKLTRSKTDQIDAKIIADFAIVNPNLRLWKPLDPNTQQLRNLSRCILTLKEDAARIKTRIQTIHDEQIKTIYQEQLKNIDLQILQVNKMLHSLVEQNQTLKTKTQILQTIPGIGLTTAITLLAELPDLENFTHIKQLSAFLGLNPSVKQSGTYINKRSSIAKMGNNILRKALFLPAMVCCRFNPVAKQFADKLKAVGKNGKVIIVAVMRKLLHIIFALLKKSSNFDPNYVFNS